MFLLLKCDSKQRRTMYSHIC